MVGQPDCLVAISLPDGSALAPGRFDLAEPSVAGAPGRSTIFHCNALPGIGLFKCVSIPLFAGGGPFPIPCEPGDYRARGSRNSLVGQTRAALDSTNWLSVLLNIADLAGHPYLAPECHVHQHRNS